MRKYKTIIFLIVMINFFVSCKKENKIDKEKPIIDLSIKDAFPVNCDTLYFGETFTLKLLFKDNVELGSFSIDIHHNFDHHTHSTEINECLIDPVKSPINPFIFIHDYSIPSGLWEYQTNIAISIPSKNENGNFDEGEYHFFISLTDKAGWSTYKGLSIKILHR